MHAHQLSWVVLEHDQIIRQPSSYPVHLMCQSSIPSSILIAYPLNFQDEIQNLGIALIVFVHNFPILTKYKMCHIFLIPTIEHGMVDV